MLLCTATSLLTILGCCLSLSRSRQAFDYFSRVPSHNSIWLDIFRDYTACPYGAAIPNCDTWQNDGAASYPHVIANCDRFGHFRSLETVPLSRVQRMCGSVQMHIGSKQHSVAYGDPAAVQQSTGKVAVEVLADRQVVALKQSELELAEQCGTHRRRQSCIMLSA